MYLNKSQNGIFFAFFTVSTFARANKYHSVVHFVFQSGCLNNKRFFSANYIMISSSDSFMNLKTMIFFRETEFVYLHLCTVNVTKGQ